MDGAEIPLSTKTDVKWKREIYFSSPLNFIFSILSAIENVLSKLYPDLFSNIKLFMVNSSFYIDKNN